MCIGQDTDGMGIIDGMGVSGAHITDDDLADEQLEIIAFEIAPELHDGLTARQAHAIQLKDKGIRGRQLTKQMQTFDAARKIETQEGHL